ncbi:MAG TPA: nitrilase-related carbon-nitrogen hydrolase [Gemmatimonadota bacterium]|nr:nitrilase-related carbon-nitrogen hydrolase [Gemmatimonadota bacterium]
MRRPVTLRVVQHRPLLGDLEANLADHRARAQAAAEDGVDLVLFPELSLTGYALGDLVDAVALEPAHPLWPDVLALSDRVDVALGYVERGPEGYLYNAAAYLHRGELLHNHRKTYLPTYGPFDEQRFFSPGHAIEAFEAPWGRGALIVCEEAWHPAVAHGAVALGAQVLLVVSNAPGRGPAEGDWASQRAWRGILAAYARLYAVWVVYANRIGYEEGFVFGGGSAIIAPDGTEAAVADPLETEELTVVLDPGAQRRARVANPAHGIERHELLIDALARAAAPEARAAALPGERAEAKS